MIKLDDRDLDILRVLAKDGRISKTTLAEQVGLSATPCWNRLKRLEQSGLISGYGARINLRKLGPHVTIFVAAELSDHTAASFQAFEAGVQRMDEIVACWGLGGGFDYLMQVVAKDIDTYQRLMDRMLEQRIGLSRYFTYIVTKSVKSSPVPPLDIITGS